MELAHATCPTLTPDLMFLSNSAQLPLKRLHVQRRVKISKKQRHCWKTTPIEKNILGSFEWTAALHTEKFYQTKSLMSRPPTSFFLRKEAQECFLSKTRIFYEMNVSVVIFIIYLYWHLFNKVLYVFHICSIWCIFLIIKKSLI